MSWRPIACALGLALVLILLPATLASAEFRGTDMWSNLAPHGGGGMTERYPLSYYTLDYHVAGPSVGFGGVDSGDTPALVAQFLAAFVFMVATFFMRLTISAFDWAFNVDIIGGHHGALGPVGTATKHLWISTFMPLLSTGVIVLGGWFLLKVIARRFSEAAVGGARAAILTAATLAIIFNPAATIGTMSSLSNDLAGAIASGSTGANGGKDVSNRLFDTFVAQPWAVLEFGGLKRCTSVETDSNGFPRYVNGESDRNVCRDVVTRYAPKFLAAAPGSSDRKALYERIRDGDAPFDKADAPAVDMMQAGGAVQRLVFTIILAFGILAGILLLGLIAVASLFAQLGLLALLVAAPAMAFVAIFPAMHGVVFAWAKLTGKFLIAKVIYAVMLAAALGVSNVLMTVGGTSQFGYLFAFGGQGVLFFGIFAYRKKLAEQLTSRQAYSRHEQNTKSFVAGAATAAVGAVAAPVAAAGVAAQAGKARLDRVTQQHAPTPQTQSTPAKEPGSLPADSSSPPAGAGREYSPNPPGGAEGSYSPASARFDHDQNSDASTTTATMPEQGEPVPTRDFRSDYEQAKAERAVEKPAPPPSTPAEPLNWTAGPESLAEALEQERAKTPSA